MIVQSVRVKNAWGVLASMGVTVAQLLTWAGAGYEPVLPCRGSTGLRYTGWCDCVGDVPANSRWEMAGVSLQVK